MRKYPDQEKVLSIYQDNPPINIIQLTRLYHDKYLSKGPGRVIDDPKKGRHKMTRKPAIKTSELHRLAQYINELTDSPAEAYTQDNARKWTANPGHYYIDGAYGGFKLLRIVKGGGSTDVLGSGYSTKRDLFNQLHAYIQGLNYRK